MLNVRTQTCCTKSSDQTNILLNNNDNIQLFSRNLPTEQEKSVHTQASIEPSIQEENL